MSWGKVCDTPHAHRKVAKAGVEAMGLWVLAMSWSRDKGTDGFIPADRPAQLTDDDAIASRCVEALVRARLWEPVDGGWQFHDWSDHYPIRETWSRLAYAEVYKRDGFTCRYCGATEKLSIDHVVPRKQNGGDEAENLVVACTSCNSRKGGRTPSQAGMVLR